MEKLQRPGCQVAYSYHPAQAEGAESTQGAEVARTVVLLHSQGLSSKMWEPQLPVLTDWGVLRMDIRGHGKSQPCEGFSVAEAAEDLYAVLEAQGITKPVLVGIALGGLVVQEYALRHGGAAGYMVVGALPMFLPRYSALELRGLRFSVTSTKALPWEMIKDNIATASTATRESRKAVKAMLNGMAKDGFMRISGEMLSCIRPEPLTFDAPILAACGMQDTVGTTLRHMRDWEKGYPGVMTPIIPGASQAANLDNPGYFNRILLAFLDKCK